jgi:GDP-4-dehydro-6-deoxy-D-mannose reductase
VAKLAAETYASYATRHGKVPAIIARPFNHIGPRQSPAFVAAAFAKQIAEAESKPTGTPEIRVGNLSAERDFTDVRDIVQGYVLLAERGIPGEIYNLTGGECLRTGQLLERLLARSKVPIQVVHDPARDRPVDVPHRRGSAEKARALGWQPVHPLDSTLDALLASWRAATAR